MKKYNHYSVLGAVVLSSFVTWIATELRHTEKETLAELVAHSLYEDPGHGGVGGREFNTVNRHHEFAKYYRKEYLDAEESGNIELSNRLYAEWQTYEGKRNIELEKRYNNMEKVRKAIIENY